MSRRRQKWRIQVDEYPAVGEEMYRERHQVYSHKTAAKRAEKYGGNITTLTNTLFDELVIDSWFHLEGMDTNSYWMNIGGLTVNVQVDGRTGKAKRVMWELDYTEAGCVYQNDQT